MLDEPSSSKSVCPVTYHDSNHVFTNIVSPGATGSNPVCLTCLCKPAKPSITVTLLQLALQSIARGSAVDCNECRVCRPDEGFDARTRTVKSPPINVTFARVVIACEAIVLNGWSGKSSVSRSHERERLNRRGIHTPIIAVYAVDFL